MFDKIIMYLVSYVKVNYSAKKALKIAWIALLFGFICMLVSNINVWGMAGFILAGLALAIMLGFEYVYAIQAEEDDE